MLKAFGTDQKRWMGITENNRKTQRKGNDRRTVRDTAIVEERLNWMSNIIIIIVW